MRRCGWSAVLLAVSLAACPATGQDVPRDLPLRVLIYDYEGVPAARMERAKAVAAEILAAAGVEVQWLHCTFPPAPPTAACEPQQAKAYLVMNVVTRAMAARLPVSEDAYGMAALPQNDDEPGYYFYVLHHRMAERDRKYRDFDAGGMMGHVVAHEIGHLLMQTTQHSQGIMRGAWNHGWFRGPQPLRMQFSPAAAARLRAARNQRVEYAARRWGSQPTTGAALLAAENGDSAAQETAPPPIYTWSDYAGRAGFAEYFLDAPPQF